MDSCLKKLGIEEINSGVFYGEWARGGEPLERSSPINGELIANVKVAASADYERAISAAQQAFFQWRSVPAPKRGETIRAFGNALRELKPELARLVTLETGKIIAEAEGEVQEMIDVCDFAVGLSRQLYGLTIASERPGHRLMEQWHPLGIVGTITAFNFPVAVWAWNSALAAVCGDALVWKPSSKTPLTAIAVTKIAERVCRETSAPPAIFTLLIGSAEVVGSRLAADKRVPLVSATGSCAMGAELARVVHQRLGRTLLELGGNNAVVVAPSADLDLATRAIVFGAVGTAGQRCTSTRRVLVHESIERELQQRVLRAYESVKIGNPLERSTVMGPLIDAKAVEEMVRAIERVEQQGGEILYGGKKLNGKQYPGGCYVTPCLAVAEPAMPMLKEETFAPLLYLVRYRTFQEALSINNNVPQGLSSSVFTNDFREAEAFLSVAGSDCGIANVNAGTSGAEIGGAFGGEKDTGGGRESGSDSWKSYMRRQTNTINYSNELPLAQGIEFGVTNGAAMLGRKRAAKNGRPAAERPARHKLGRRKTPVNSRFA